MSALNQTEPGKYELEVGADDTDDGISVRVVGKTYPSINLTSEGILVGDGDAPPEQATYADLSDIEDDVAALETKVPSPVPAADGTYVLGVTVASNVPTYAWVLYTADLTP